MEGIGLANRSCGPAPPGDQYYLYYSIIHPTPFVDAHFKRGAEEFFAECCPSYGFDLDLAKQGT